jgi:hypothetical protein
VVTDCGGVGGWATVTDAGAGACGAGACAAITDADGGAGACTAITDAGGAGASTTVTDAGGAGACTPVTDAGGTGTPSGCCRSTCLAMILRMLMVVRLIAPPTPRS